MLLLLGIVLSTMTGMSDHVRWVIPKYTHHRYILTCYLLRYNTFNYNTGAIYGGMHYIT